MIGDPKLSLEDMGIQLRSRDVVLCSTGANVSLPGLHAPLRDRSSDVHIVTKGNWSMACRREFPKAPCRS